MRRLDQGDEQAKFEVQGKGNFEKHKDRLIAATLETFNASVSNQFERYLEFASSEDQFLRYEIAGDISTKIETKL